MGPSRARGVGVTDETRRNEPFDLVDQPLPRIVDENRSHRHLPATRRPDGKFYFGYRPAAAGYSPDRVDALVWAFSELLVEPMPGEGIYEFYRGQAEAAAQRSKPQPPQSVPQPGSMEWFKAQKNKG